MHSTRYLTASGHSRAAWSDWPGARRACRHPVRMQHGSEDFSLGQIPRAGTEDEPGNTGETER
jgi:hypothetical protein